jgi:UDPglucose 6-dehydrogenase
MKIGFMGLGKLGLPCALVAEQKGHEVVGYDPSPDVQQYVATKKIPYREEGAPEALKNSKIRCVSVKEMVEFSDLIFVAVQTPHNPLYEGTTRIPETRVDFDYTYLIDACKQLNAEIEALGQDKVVVIISTVLPGTLDEKVLPLLGSHVRLCYNPFFIAMGTTMRDFQHPEFVLFGMADENAAQVAETFYKTIHSAPFYRCSIKSAELIKVAYNTFISTKIAFVNHLMEICHYTVADVDEVTDALKLGTERLNSTK